MAVKQVIVIRKDLNMRRGKEISQGAHASSMWLVKRSVDSQKTDSTKKEFASIFTQDELEWMMGSFTKVTVRVNSEQELSQIYEKAQEAGLTVHMVTDLGKTEFNGVQTNTCLCIGPNQSELIDAITGKLELY